MATIAKLFKGTIQGEKLVLDEPQKFKDSFKLYKDGARVDVYHRKETKEKSYPQCKYFFGVVVEIFHKETGEDKDRIYEALLLKFSQTITDKGWYVTKRLSEMTTVEAEEFFEKCRRYGAECGYYIPEPNEIELL